MITFEFRSRLGLIKIIDKFVKFQKFPNVTSPGKMAFKTRYQDASRRMRNTAVEDTRYDYFGRDQK
jgi:hypothetical protein